MRDDRGNASPEQEKASRTRIFVTAAVLLIIAWLVYRPDRERPLHILDFSEFIPVLQGGSGLLDSVGEIVKYYASQGRFNVIPYVLLAVKWDAFGWWSPGWQVARALMMAALLALTFVLLRRLGASRSGALIGGSVYLFAPSATDGWVRMTIAEPLSGVLMLAAAIRATRFQSTDRWPREVAILSVAAFAIIWTKELTAPLLLIPVGLALSVQPDGSFAFPRASRRNVILFASVALTSVLALIPIALIYLTGGESAYASMYGRGTQSLSALLVFWVLALIPFDFIIVPANVLWAMAVAGFLFLVAVGWRMGFSDPADGRRARWLLAIALVVPLAGVLAYIPNPWYANFYTLPYLIGAALLTGLGATWLERSSRGGRALAVVAWLVMMAHAATRSSAYVAMTDAVQRRDAWIVAYVADSLPDDSVQFATKVRPPYDWLGFGAAMSRISAAKGTPWPPTRNVNCEEAREAMTSERQVITVNMESSCEFDAPGMKVISRRFTRFDARKLRFVDDSVHADIVLPGNYKPSQ